MQLRTVKFVKEKYTLVTYKNPCTGLYMHAYIISSKCLSSVIMLFWDSSQFTSPVLSSDMFVKYFKESWNYVAVEKKGDFQIF